ncbi:ester cyclase [Halorubellus sp. PRR65]|uniref:ester cyclase n=1 Tax=Halorubellus sp. PRR65 TaxID=3098148 RepID=UPI002B25AD7E|nr:ester cyclase [Halorubellus sp. PRR65]
MSTTTATETERIAREHFDRVWNHGEVDESVLADDYRVHTNFGEAETHTLQSFERALEHMRDAVPDMQKEPADVVATDDRAVIRYTMTGTQQGEFRGIPATGEPIETEAIAMYRFEGSKIAEAWIVADFLRAMRQLGVAD